MAVKKKPAPKAAVKKPVAKKAVVKKTPKPEAAPAKPQVFVDRGRRVFLLIKEGTTDNQYVTRQDEEIRTVSLEIGQPRRDTQGNLIEHTHCTADLIPYDKRSAKDTAKSLLDSLLPKTSKAMVALCEFLGIPVPEVPAAVKKARKAAGERLKAARPERVGYTIQQLCAKLGIEPSIARKALRKSNVEKPEAGWVWSTEAEADAVARCIGLMPEAKATPAAKKKVTKK